ncbi:MAG: ribosome recycling factor [Planctomycetes bacterium]|nr:ribosome recycling factor [Planctomycetota bacterium]
MELDYDSILSDCRSKMSKCVEYLEHELKGLRTGRASAGLVETVRVDYYGTMTPLSQMAQISTPDPKTIAIKPFDATALKGIEKAIMAANLGITPSSDGKMIRLNVPPLTEQTRKQLVGKVKELAESQRIAIRNVRRDANKASDAAKDDGMTEDDQRRLQGEIQDATKAHEKLVDQVFESKSKEIMEV